MQELCAWKSERVWRVSTQILIPMVCMCARDRDSSTPTSSIISALNAHDRHTLACERNVVCNESSHYTDSITQDAPLDNQYILAIKAHLVYWFDLDTALFMFQRMFPAPTPEDPGASKGKEGE